MYFKVSWSEKERILVAANNVANKEVLELPHRTLYCR